MTDIAIRVENLSKQYRIGASKNNRNLREALIEGLKAPFRRAGRLLQGHAKGAAELEETIWALRDVSFEIKKGETVGIIGPNGSGKSTALKILSRITEPTLGFAEIYGRVGSLLEVGTGFHSELTGRENIYLSGAILGMRRAEIKRKYDDIVAFAEIGKFIDTPVKHYSSGMYLRLAFAVAAHLEPEILIVDEVLAVGDTRFQKKCLKKMEDIGQEGQTVLFVSHSMSAITQLCQRAILVDQGLIIKDGPSREVVDSYLKSDNATIAERVWCDLSKAPKSDVVRLRAVRVKTKDGLITEMVYISQAVEIEIEYDVLKSGYILLPILNFYTGTGISVFESNDIDPTWRRRPRSVGHWTSTVRIPKNFLSEGMLLVTLSFVTLDPFVGQFKESNALVFHVADDMKEDSARGDYPGKMESGVRPVLKWSTKFNPMSMGK